MDKKRFTFDWEVEFEIFDNVTKKSYDGTVGCQEKICQLLNELNEENRQLEVLLQEAEDEIDRLKKSNKQWMESLVNMESED